VQVLQLLVKRPIDDASEIYLMDAFLEPPRVQAGVMQDQLLPDLLLGLLHSAYGLL
jgi:hypothetical protein